MVVWDCKCHNIVRLLKFLILRNGLSQKKYCESVPENMLLIVLTITTLKTSKFPSLETNLTHQSTKMVVKTGWPSSPILVGKLATNH